MKIGKTSVGNPSVKWLKIFLVTILLLGISFRFINLDNKVYWMDETYTALRASGYTELEVTQQIRDGNLLNSEDIQKYQYSNSSKSAKDVIQSLADEDPQHPPLYYLMSKFWVEWLGNNVSTRRSLSAMASLLALPLIYWLCLELFNSSLVGLVAAAILAISPFHVLYAQEARQYSLWTATILFSSASLLWALRKKSKYIWIVYSISLALSLYTFLLSVIVAISHGIYVLTIEGFRLSKTFINYLIASILGILMFLPWMWVVANNITHIDSITGGSKKLSGLSYYITISKEWLVNLSRIFVDIIGDSGASSNLLSPITILLFIIVCSSLILTIYSMYFIWKNTEKKVWMFVITIISVNYIFLILPDLVLGNSRSIVSRLFTPAYIGIQLLIAYFITSILNSFLVDSWWQKAKLSLVMIFFSLSLISCVIITQSQTSWAKSIGKYNHLVANVINQSSNPLLISTNFGGASDVISLSYYLEPKVKIFAQPTCYTCSFIFSKDSRLSSQLPSLFNQFSDVFFFNSKLPSELNTQYKLTPVLLPNTRTGKSLDSGLWKLEKS